MPFLASFTPAALDWQKRRSILALYIMNGTLPMSICLLVTNLSFSVICGPGLKPLGRLDRAESSASSMAGLPITNKKVCLGHIQVSDCIYYHVQGLNLTGPQQ